MVCQYVEISKNPGEIVLRLIRILVGYFFSNCKLFHSIDWQSSRQARISYARVRVDILIAAESVVLDGLIEYLSKLYASDRSSSPILTLYSHVFYSNIKTLPGVSIQQECNILDHKWHETTFYCIETFQIASRIYLRQYFNIEKERRMELFLNFLTQTIPMPSHSCAQISYLAENAEVHKKQKTGTELNISSAY